MNFTYEQRASKNGDQMDIKVNLRQKMEHHISLGGKNNKN